MKQLLIFFLILISGSSFAQQWTTMRLTPGTTTLPSGNGWMRYYSSDHKLQMRINDTIRNVATEDWVSSNFSGGVSGSTGSTDNAILVADGTGGSTIKASNVTIDASGNISTSGIVATEEIQGDDISITASSTMQMQANGGDINIATEHIHIDPTQNLTFFSTAPNPTEYGGGVNVIHLSEASMVPNSNPTSGSILYAESGAFKARGTSGTVTTIAPADPHCPSCGSDFVCEYENEKYGYLAMCFKCLSENMDKPRRKRKPFFTTVKGAWSKHKNPTP